jgi:transcriptional regulator with XRE-family HTH domain
VDAAQVGSNPALGLDLDSIKNLEEFARALRMLKARAERMINRGLTCRRLADITGYSRSSISSWLSGKSLPPRDKLDDLLHALAVTTQENTLLAARRDEIEDARRESPGPAAGAEPGTQAPAPRGFPRWPNPPFMRAVAALVAAGLAAAGFLVVEGADPGGAPSSPAMTPPAASALSPLPQTDPAGSSQAVTGVRKVLLYPTDGTSLGTNPSNRYDVVFRTTPRKFFLEFGSGHISLPGSQSLSYQACTNGTELYPGTAIPVPRAGAILCYTTRDSVSAIRIVNYDMIPRDYPWVKLEYETWPAR